MWQEGRCVILQDVIFCQGIARSASWHWIHIKLPLSSSFVTFIIFRCSKLRKAQKTNFYFFLRVLHIVLDILQGSIRTESLQWLRGEIHLVQWCVSADSCSDALRGGWADTEPCFLFCSPIVFGSQLFWNFGIWEFHWDHWA